MENLSFIVFRSVSQSVGLGFDFFFCFFNACICTCLHTEMYRKEDEFVSLSLPWRVICAHVFHVWTLSFWARMFVLHNIRKSVNIDIYKFFSKYISWCVYTFVFRQCTLYGESLEIYLHENASHQMPYTFAHTHTNKYMHVFTFNGEKKMLCTHQFTKWTRIGVSVSMSIHLYPWMKNYHQKAPEWEIAPKTIQQNININSILNRNEWMYSFISCESNFIWKCGWMTIENCRTL